MEHSRYLQPSDPVLLGIDRPRNFRAKSRTLEARNGLFRTNKARPYVVVF